MEAGSSSAKEYAHYVRPSQVGKQMRKDLDIAIRMTQPEWGGRTTFKNLMNDCLDGDNLLFVVEEDGRYVAFMLCGLFSLTAGGRLLDVQWSGGLKVLANLEKLVNAAEQAAEFMNVTYIQMTGRPAWVKILRPYGFKPVTFNIGKVPNYVLQPKAAEGNTDDKAGAVSGAEGAPADGDGSDQPGGAEHSKHAGGSGS